MANARRGQPHRSFPRPSAQGGLFALGPEVQGEVLRTTYRDEESGFSVVKVKTAHGEVTLVGALPALATGERVAAKGKPKTHPSYGPQLEVEEIERLLPVTPEGIVAYLGSGLIPGIGPKLAQRIYDHFGEESLEVVRREPRRLAEVPGIGHRRIVEANRTAKAQVRLERLVVALRPYQVPLHVARKIEARYGDEAEQIVAHEPYRLWRDVGGIGFLTADRVARAMGIAEDAPARMEALVLYLLQTAMDEGHVCLPEEELVQRAVRLGGTEGRTAGALRDLAEGGLVVLEDDFAYLTRNHQMEKRVARAVARHLEARPPAVALRNRGTLSPAQAAAAQAALGRGLFVLTGGPGTGKTTTVQAIARSAIGHGLRLELAAPTGRAAKRMQEASGLRAQTLHRLLGLRGPQSDVHEISADLVIVDEASMIDLWLFDRLLDALPLTARLVLVGDPDQLPPVGAGQPFADLLGRREVPRAELTEIFRQAAQSGIVQAAHRIRQGYLPQQAEDFVWLQAEAPLELQRLALQAATETLPRLGIEPDEIQVLSAGHKHESGVQALNAALQAKLNPPRGQAELRHGDRIFRLGDRVVQLRNDYQRGALNGEVGRITRLGAKDRGLAVAFPDASGEREVEYEPDELRQLQLGYATTVHKAQGSEYRGVVLVLSPQHWMLLQRNLLYTAVTRARERIVVVAPARALRQALRAEGRDVRHGRLGARIVAALTARSDS
jgi:exodeoxyribonuclease V alpha subunit